MLLFFGGITNPLLNLIIIPETSIQKQSSPILRDQYIFDTQDISIFKMVLTGIDDSSLISKKKIADMRNYNEAKIQILSEMIMKIKSQIDDRYSNINDAEQQISKLDENIKKEKEILDTSEQHYRGKIKIQSNLRKELQNYKERNNEILGMIKRFDLLDKHYTSDLLRLDGIRETGTFISVLNDNQCPLCGASPESQNHIGSCDMNISATINAATIEYNKIKLLKSELNQTVSNLSHELSIIESTLPSISSKLQSLDDDLKKITPDIKDGNEKFSELIDKRSEVISIIFAYNQIYEFTQEIENIRKMTPVKSKEQPESSSLSKDTLDSFSRKLETIFKDWNLSGLDRVYFDTKTNDLVIAGKPRGNRGKGLRAITYAAFIVGVLKYCKDSNLPHFGAIILDSPLLAYRAPDNPEDSLAGTDVQENFYRFLLNITDRQIIVIENTDPPFFVRELDCCTYFSGNPSLGRAGFFPPQRLTELS